MNKLFLMVFVCLVTDISARLIHHHENNVDELYLLQSHCNTKHGKYFCKYSNNCIDVTDECKNLITSYSYINSLFW